MPVVCSLWHFASLQTGKMRSTAFIPEEYWSLDANFKVKGEKKPLTAKFYGTKDEKITIHNEEELHKILADLEEAEYEVVDVKRGETK